MKRTRTKSHCCTQHPIFPRKQIKYIIDALIELARSHEFDISKLNRREDWDAIANKFDAKFHRKLLGNADRQTVQTIKMILCANEENVDEFSDLYYGARQKFRAEKKEAEKRKRGGKGQKL